MFVESAILSRDKMFDKCFGMNKMTKDREILQKKRE